MPLLGFMKSGAPSPVGATPPSAPPGVLPRRINYVIIGGIIALIFIASIFSGHKGKRVEETKAPSGPSQSQLKNFKDMLERQRREEANKQLEEKRRLEEQERLRLSAQPSASTAGNASESQEDRRRANAPFASNIAVRIVEREDKVPLDHAPQVVLHAELSASADDATAESVVEQPKESGRRLPERDGNLFRLYEGTTIQAVLANRLDGSFTGPVVCLVSKDIFSKAGTALLIPKGSRFIGKANRVEAQNQARLAVNFKRLLMPNGYSIDLESAPGLDRSGEAGLKDLVKNHRLRTFGISGAIGLLGGLSLYRSPGSAYAAGVANATGSSATSALSQYLNAVPTITIREGHQVVVYLPSDLLLPEYRP